MAELTVNLHHVPQRPLIDLTSQAVWYYIHDHLRSLDDLENLSRTISDDILPIWMSKAGCPTHELAISTLALAAFSHTHQHPQAAIEASKSYNRLLRAAQQELLSLNEDNIDNCLIVNFFLSRYEDSVHLHLGLPIAISARSFSHHDGALAILKFWKTQLSQKQPASNVIKNIRRGMIRSALLRSIGLPEWIQDGSSFGICGLELGYDCNIVQVVRIRHELSSLLSTNEALYTAQELISKASELNRDAKQVDEALQVWASHFPISWRSQQHVLPVGNAWPTRNFYSAIVHSYSSFACAAVWSHYFATRMILNGMRLRALNICCEMSDDCSCEQHSECLSNFTDMANDFASSIPFCLERFKITNDCKSSTPVLTMNTNENIKPYLARLVAWPLTFASSFGYGDRKEILWFRSELAHIGRVVGVKVMQYANTKHWFDLNT
jgi:hypothetical protein